MEEKGHARAGTGWPRNRRHVEKVCKNCTEPFETDMPWKKHCSWNCMCEWREKRQKERRQRSAAVKVHGVTCLVCRKVEPDVAITLWDNDKKGVCYNCIKILEALGFDPKRAYRAAYAIGRIASRQGRRTPQGGNNR